MLLRSLLEGEEKHVAGRKLRQKPALMGGPSAEEWRRWRDRYRKEGWNSRKQNKVGLTGV